MDSELAAPGARACMPARVRFSEHFSSIFGEVDRRGVKHDTGGAALSVPCGLGMGRASGIELWGLVGEVSKESLCRCALSRRHRPCVESLPGGATLNAGSQGGRGAAWCRRFGRPHISVFRRLLSRLRDARRMATFPKTFFLQPRPILRTAPWRVGFEQRLRHHSL